MALEYHQQLRRLIAAAGDPDSAKVCAEIARDLPRGREAPRVATVRGWLEHGRIGRDTDELKLFLAALGRIAQARQGESFRPLPEPHWDRLIREGRRRTAAKGSATTAGTRPPAGKDPGNPGTWSSATLVAGADWAAAVADSHAWRLVAPDARETADELKRQAEGVVRELLARYGEWEEVLARDPWRDSNLVRRTARWTNLLLRRFDGGQGGEGAVLAPVEAALLALLPMLHEMQRAATVAALVHIDPENLDDGTRAGPERESYNRVLRSHRRLVRQALRGSTLPDRRDGRREFGWWLFRQWARGRPGRLPEVVYEPATEQREISAVLQPQLLSRLLACASAVPRKLYGRGREGLLREDPAYVDFGGRGGQEVRERLVGPVFAIAHAMAMEVTELPATVVKHVGIPDPLDPGRLLRTLDAASWVPAGDTLGLSAECDHPAAVAGLTEHVGYVDALLREARRGRPPAGLPVYAHADEVRESDDGPSASPGPGAVIRFRLDEERVQELLMGENLYRDQGLAIRELYQNALDACRYRRAWQRARDGRDTFEAEITFRQGYDERERRHYLECEDNGIGMDETVLDEVFSRAGVRFADHARFQEEAQSWQAEGITVHPNSRFGIGVLSYFMLADEIRVTTCPLDAGEGRPEQLTVLITGPGHYFRVRHTGRRGPVGTTVRLYLRDGNRAPSCVRELHRLLGLAEFTTVARHGTQEARWRPGEFRPREASVGRTGGYVAHGRTVSWPESGYGADGQVVWCEEGGGILADGIAIEPRVRRGVLASPMENCQLRGAVVNLTGPGRPGSLSVDRTQILDEDLDEKVERLVRAALPALVAADPPLLTAGWLEKVTRANPRLADLVTEAAGRAGMVLKTGRYDVPVARAGYFPEDDQLVPGLGGYLHPINRLAPDDVVQLWRLLAHATEAGLVALTTVVPELSRVEAVLPARPSDYFLAGSFDIRRGIWFAGEQERAQRSFPGHALSVALVCGMPYEEVVERMRLLGLDCPQRPRGEVNVDAVGMTLLDKQLRVVVGTDARAEWLDPAQPVPPGHLLKAHLLLGVPVSEAAGRLAALGFTVPPDMPTETPEDWVVRLLSDELAGEAPWLDPGQPVRAGHVLRAVAELDLPFPEVVGRLEAYGYRVDLGTLDRRAVPELLRQVAEWGWSTAETGRLGAGEPVPAFLTARAVVASGLAPREIVRRLQTWGLDAGSLPEHVEETDLTILGNMAAGHRAVPLAWVARQAFATGLPPAAVAARLRAYGLDAPAAPYPERAEKRDEDLLEGMEGRTSLPLSAVYRAASWASTSPDVVVDRLTAYGVRGARDVALAAKHLVGPALLTTGETADWPEKDKPVPPYQLLSMADALAKDEDVVAARLARLGLRVSAVDTGALDETDRYLCTVVNRSSDGRPRLLLGRPIQDFLDILHKSRLPPADLVRRLTRLGVDLDRVAEAVRAALPRVPGIVMAPEGGSPAA